MSKPKVSVVIPVYNMEKYLKRCLDTIVNQTLKDIEIILVNDGSKDMSGKICDEYKALDSRIKVIHKENAGLGFARNSGMEIATGEYISFVDSDDYVKTDMYEKLYNHIKRENADTCIFGYHRMIGSKVQFTHTMSLKGTYSDQEVFNVIFLNVLGSEPSCRDDFLILWQSSWLSLYSLDLIHSHKLSFPSEREYISEDVLFNTDYYIRSKRVTILNEAFYHYCLNETSLTKVFREDRYAKNVVLYHEHLRRLKNYLPDEKAFNMAKERVQRILLASARYCIMQISAFFSYKDARQHIKNICNDSALQEVLHVYPWNKNPMKYRLFNSGMAGHKLWFLYFLGKFKRK